MRSGRTAGAVVVLWVTALTALVACSDPAEHQRRPEQGDLYAAITRQLGLRPGHENVRAILVTVDGRPVVERYDDVPSDQSWDLGWGTVAVTATLVGMALDDGSISGLDATLGELLPDHADDMSRSVAATTVRQVLTMTAGFQGTGDEDTVGAYMTAADPVGAILRAARPTATHRFDYSSQGAHVLGAVVAEATGTPLLEYARRHLFEPLGITTSGTGFAWDVDSSGLQQGWTSLALAPSDVARLGQLYADDGMWRGHRLLSSSWVHEATRVQVENVAHPSDNFSGYGGYGFGWWLIESDGSPAFFVADLTGQLLEVLPTHHLVVVVASEPVPGTTSAGVTPDALTFLVNDVIGPGVRK